jgi:hypothetical protein
LIAQPWQVFGISEEGKKFVVGFSRASLSKYQMEDEFLGDIE